MAIIDQLNSSFLCIPNIVDQSGPIFDNGSGNTQIHALVENGQALLSDDLLDGYSGPSFYAPPSQPPVSLPDSFVFGPFYPAYGGGTTYSQAGPPEGMY